MPELDAIDVLFRVQGLRKFIAETEAARASISKINADAAAAGGAGGAAAAGAGGSKSKAQAAALGLVRKAAIGTGLAVAGIGFESAKMSIKFDESVTRLNTQAGEAKKNLGYLSDETLKMARSVGIGPQSLAEGLYHLESIGLRRTTGAMKALRVAADLAAVGNSNLETTATALGSAWVTGIKGAGDFTHVAALMNAAVGSGNIRMQELAEALGTGILPNARVAGLSIQNVFAALATLTDAGWKASSASAQLATAFHYLYAPSTKASKALAEMNLTGLDLIKTMRARGLPAALKQLRSHLNEFSKDPNIQAQQIAKIIPGGRGRTLTALITMLPRLEAKERFQQESTNKKYAEAVATYHKTAAFKIRSAWAGVQADMVKVGKMLQPVAVFAAQALGKIADSVLWFIKAVKDMVKWVKDASPQVKALLLFFGLFAGQVIIFIAVVRVWAMLTAGIKAAKLAMEAFSTASKLALLANPWAVAIMAIIVMIVAIATHWEQAKKVADVIWKWMKGAWHDTVGWIVKAAEDTWNWFKNKWPLLVAILAGPFGIAVYEIIKHWHEIVKFMEGLGKTFAKVGEIIWDALFAGIKWYINNFLIAPLNIVIEAINAMATAYNDIPIHIGTAPHVSPIHGLAEGGNILSSGSVVVGERGPELLHLPRGAQVAPLDGKFGDPGMAPKWMSHVVVQVEKKTIAEATGEYTAEKMARR